MTQKETPKNETKKKEVKPTFVSLIREVWQKKHTDRKAVVVEVLANAKSRSITVNAKGQTITEKNITSLLNAMCRDITSERKGWWSKFKVVSETEKGKENFQVLTKE